MTSMHELVEPFKTESECVEELIFYALCCAIDVTSSVIVENLLSTFYESGSKFLCNVNRKDNEIGSTALHHAVGGGCHYNFNQDTLKIIKLLLKSRNIDVNATNDFGCTALYNAIKDYWVPLDVVETLLDDQNRLTGKNGCLYVNEATVVAALSKSSHKTLDDECIMKSVDNGLERLFNALKTAKHVKGNIGQFIQNNVDIIALNAFWDGSADKVLRSLVTNERKLSQMKNMARVKALWRPLMVMFGAYIVSVVALSPFATYLS